MKYIFLIIIIIYRIYALFWFVATYMHILFYTLQNKKQNMHILFYTLQNKKQNAIIDPFIAGGNI